jgi:hypothetical protein
MDHTTGGPAAAEHVAPQRVGVSPVDARSVAGSIDDPRALTILTTEHWSLLSARSLVYNEAFSRAGMFLTFLSASLVALALVAQGMGFTHEFLLLVAIILALDLLVGLATLGRVSDASKEDLRTIAGMNRIRHAYLEIAPGLEPYFITSRYDDLPGVLTTYGETSSEQPSMARNIAHGLTTTLGMVSVITNIIAGMLAAVVALLLGATAAVALIAGAIVFVAFVTVLTAIAVRDVDQFGTGIGPRFATPRDPATPAEPKTGR